MDKNVPPAGHPRMPQPRPNLRNYLEIFTRPIRPQSQIQNLQVGRMETLNQDPRSNQQQRQQLDNGAKSPHVTQETGRQLAEQPDQTPQTLDQLHQQQHSSQQQVVGQHKLEKKLTISYVPAQGSSSAGVNQTAGGHKLEKKLTISYVPAQGQGSSTKNSKT